MEVAGKLSASNYFSSRCPCVLTKFKNITIIKNNFIIENAVDSLENKYPSNMSLLNDKTIEKEFLNQHDLMIISLESWKSLVDSQSDWLSGVPSVLILKP